MPLYGRAAETAVLQAFLEEAREQGGALSINGLPGVGVTSLLGELRELALAEQFTVIEFDGSSLGSAGFGGLLQLAALLGRHLPPEQQPRLESFGERVLSGTSAGQPEQLSTELAALIRELPRPVLLVTELTTTLDEQTVRMLIDMIEPLRVPGVALCGSLRREMVGRLPTSVRVIEVQPLQEQAASELLAVRAPELTAAERDRLVQAGEGNPAVLLDLAAGELLPGFTEACRLRLAPLPEDVRWALLLLASNDHAGMTEWQTLAGAEAAAVCRHSGLVAVGSEGSVRLNHGLLAGVVSDLATAEQRRSAHMRWADALRQSDPARSLQHRVRSTFGTDEVLAQALEEQAAWSRREGDEQGGLWAAEQAVHFSGAPQARARRLTAAAYAEGMAGRARAASALLAQARRAELPGTGLLPETATTAFLLMLGDGDAEDSMAMLGNAIDQLPDQGDALDPDVEFGLRTMFRVVLLSQARKHWEQLRLRLDALREPIPVGLDLARQTARLSSFEQVDRAALQRLLNQAADEPSVEDLQWLSYPLIQLERLGEIRGSIQSAVEQMGDDSGSLRMQFEFLLAYLQMRSGQWHTAMASAQRGLSRMDAREPGHAAWAMQGVQGLIAAHRGEAELAQEMSDQIMHWAIPRGLGGAQHFTLQIRGAVAMAAGEMEEALRYFEQIAPLGDPPLSATAPVTVTFDLVYLAVRANRQAEAQRHLDVLIASGIDRLSAYFELLIRGAQAVVATEAATEAFERALALPGARTWPFEWARIELAYGEHLRRSGAVSLSREHLGSAREVLADLGLRPWVERTDVELAACGPAPGLAVPKRLGELSAQELRIAILAAEGLTNKQIAERLYLSPRTVGNHLHRVFPKLDVTSRAGLRQALGPVTGIASTTGPGV